MQHGGAPNMPHGLDAVVPSSAEGQAHIPAVTETRKSWEGGLVPGNLLGDGGVLSCFE